MENTMGNDEEDALAIVVIAFDHALGPTSEWVHPPTLATDPDLLKSNLPFLALPDGAHTVSLHLSSSLLLSLTLVNSLQRRKRKITATFIYFYPIYQIPQSLESLVIDKLPQIHY